MANQTRRRFLRYSAGTIAAAVGLSGCLGTPGGGSGGDEHEALFDRAPVYTWLPSAAELGVDHYGFQAYSAQAVQASADALPSQVVERFRGSAANNVPRYFGIEGEAVDYTARIAPESSGDPPYLVAHVVVGSFGSGTVRSSLSSEGFEAGGSYGEYDLFRSKYPRRRTVAVTDGAAVVVEERNQDRRRTAIEALVDAHAGDRRRYVESSEDFEALATTIGRGLQFSGGTTPEATRATTGSGTRQIPGRVATGFEMEANDEGGLRARLVVVFPSASAADRSAVREFLRETEKMLPIRPDAPLSTEGRVVTATQPIPTEGFSSAQ